jgi:uncharacterized protein YjiS (DUF1127 family)
MTALAITPCARPGRAVAERPAGNPIEALRRAWRAYRTYVETLRALRAREIRELEDIGLAGADLEDVARRATYDRA